MIRLFYRFVNSFVNVFLWFSIPQRRVESVPVEPVLGVVVLDEYKRAKRHHVRFPAASLEPVTP